MFTFLKRMWSWLRSQFMAPVSETEEPGQEEAAPEPEAPAVRPREFHAALICTPGAYSDARKAVEALQAGRIVMVSLSSTDEESAARILDFLSGAVYLLKGTIRVMGSSVLLCTPASVRVEQDDFSFHADLLLRWKGANL